MATHQDEKNEISMSFRLKGKKADDFRRFLKLMEKKAGFTCTYAQAVTAAVDMATKVLEAELPKDNIDMIPATGE